MRKCALLIGINETAGLPNLVAAISGATEMCDWAREKGYDTSLLVDTQGPVTLTQVQDRIRAFISAECYDVLLIYFAGHGIQRTPGFEVWFLSGATRNAAEAIDLAVSSGYSTVCGIPHVVFISDACRSRTTGPQMAILGANIFPIDLDFPRQAVTVDKLYATMPGAMAWEARRANGNNGGIYTEELLRVLRGEIPEVLRRLDLHGDEFTVVMTREISNYLTRAVPEIIRDQRLRIEQVPWGEVTSAPPLHLAIYDDFRGIHAAPVDNERIAGRLGEKLDGVLAARRDGDSLRRDAYNKIESLQARGEEGPNRVRCSFRVVGAKVISIVTSYSYYEYDLHDETTYLTFPRDPMPFPQNVVIQLDNGKAIPLMVLPDFVGVVIFDNKRLMNVSYVPAHDTPRRYEYEQVRGEIERRKALIAIAAEYGVFQEGSEAGSYLRQYKSFDPMLGLFAAYAYVNSGNFEGVRSIYNYMQQEREPVLTDVALLSRFRNEDFFPVDRFYFLYNFPLLTQGWSFFAAWGDRRSKQLAGMLVPGLWTTFTPKGFRFILKNYDWQ